jgi:hypothetical protein
MAGTYLGDKKILSIEAGAIYQKNATWRLVGIDTVFDNMLLWSVAAFADMPLKNNRYAISAYVGYYSTDYGKNYIRNNGIMNPANGTTNASILSGGGNSYPMFGTGSSVYTQAGFRLPNDMLGALGTLMPYVSYRWSAYDKLKDPVSIYNAGVNWLVDKHTNKISLNYELRPVFVKQLNGDITHSSNAGCAWIQYQVAL